jgi:CBS domain-containing protein
MAQFVSNVMTPDPVGMIASTPLSDAARRMKAEGIGDVLVLDGNSLQGLVTDRDIVVRALAEDRDPRTTTLGDVCSTELVTIAPDAPVDEAVRLMRDKALRRLPVVADGQPVGIVSLGDLAVERDPNSALSDISAAPPNA